MTNIQSYFKGEKYASLFFVILGALCYLGAFYFWLAINNEFYNGIGWPILFVATIQLFGGTFIYFRTNTDLNRVLTFASKSAKNIRNMEIPRMEKVLGRYKLYHKIELALCLFGLVFFLICKSEGFWKGFGLGIIIQAGIMLIANAFAENRGKIYLIYLKKQFK